MRISEHRQIHICAAQLNVQMNHGSDQFSGQFHRSETRAHLIRWIELTFSSTTSEKFLFNSTHNGIAIFEIFSINFLREEIKFNLRASGPCYINSVLFPFATFKSFSYERNTTLGSRFNPSVRVI